MNQLSFNPVTDPLFNLFFSQITVTPFCVTGEEQLLFQVQPRESYYHSVIKWLKSLATATCGAPTEIYWSVRCVSCQYDCITRYAVTHHLCVPLCNASLNTLKLQFNFTFNCTVSRLQSANLHHAVIDLIPRQKKGLCNADLNFMTPFYSLAWHTFSQIEGIDPVYIPVKMDVVGCPLNFQMMKDQAPILR